MSRPQPFAPSLALPRVAMAIMAIMAASSVAFTANATPVGSDLYDSLDPKIERADSRHRATPPNQRWIDVFDDEGRLEIDIERDVFTELASEEGVVLFGRIVTDENGAGQHYQFVQGDYDGVEEFLDNSDLSITVSEAPADSDADGSAVTPPPGRYLLEEFSRPEHVESELLERMIERQERQGAFPTPRNTLLGSHPGTVHVATVPVDGQREFIGTYCYEYYGYVGTGQSAYYYFSQTWQAYGWLQAFSGDPDLYIYERDWWMWWWTFETASTLPAGYVDFALDWYDNWILYDGYHAMEVYGYQSSSYYLYACKYDGDLW